VTAVEEEEDEVVVEVVAVDSEAWRRTAAWAR
jgi:hypothetical protein